MGLGERALRSGWLGGARRRAGALVALDSPEPLPARRDALKLHEYVWWFLGALLVLGGSVMGVREAWRALGGVPRQLIVTGALFAYHAGFIGLGVFLARRSLSAGRVLASIGLALMPVVFVALSALVGLSPMVGLPCALVVAGLWLLTLRLAGRLLHGTSVVALALALFPSLLAELPLMWLDDSPWPRALCAFAGVAALGVSLWRSERAGKGQAPFVSVGAGALWRAGPGRLLRGQWLRTASMRWTRGAPFAGMALWAVALAGIVARRGDAGLRARGVSPCGTRGGGCWLTRWWPVARSPGTLAAFSLVPGWTLGGCRLGAALPRRRRWPSSCSSPAAVRSSTWEYSAATLAGFLLARLQVPGNAAWWCVGIAAVASGLLLIARQIETERRCGSGC